MSRLRLRGGEGHAGRQRAFAVFVAVLLATAAGGRAQGQETEVGPPPPAPVPVLLVPGWFDTAVSMAGLRARLHAAGWPSTHVGAVTFADPVGGNREHADEISVAVEHLLERTGEEMVDVVAHSMGGLATRWYLRERPGRVRRVVFLATPHRGTVSAYLAFGEGRDDMLPGSPFLTALNAGPAVPPGVEALTVRTLLDTHVLPGASATLRGVRDVTVCCPTHAGLTRDLEAFEALLAFLTKEGR